MNKIRLAYIECVKYRDVSPAYMDLAEVYEGGSAIGRLRLPGWSSKSFLFYSACGKEGFFRHMRNGDFISANQQFWVHDYESR